MTLLEALRQPNDASFHFKAQHLEKALPDEPRWNVRSISVLGPSPDEFECDEEWVNYKSGVKAFFKDPSSVKELNAILGTYRQPLNAAEHSWSTLLFHPKHWHLLPTTGLISPRELERLLSREWARLMAIPKRLIELCAQSYGYFRDEQWMLPLVPILRVAVSLQNAGQLDESPLARSILLQADVSKLKATEIHELIDSIQNASTLPDSWAQIIISAVVFTENIDAQRLSKLWNVLNRKRLMYLGRSPFHSPSEENKAYLLMELLENGGDDSLDLAAAISLSLTKVDDKISRALNERIAGALKESEEEKSQKLTQIYALLSSRTTLAESRLYTDAAWFKAAAELSPFVSNRIAEKIVTMPQTLARRDYAALRVSLEKLIEPANGYPDGVAAAALNALIQMDIANRAPLSETMWQLANVS